MRLRRPLVFHVGRAPEPSEFCGVRRMRPVLRDFPELPAVIAHMGADEFEAFFDLAEAYDHVYLDTTLVFTDLLGWRPRLERVVALQDRIVYGSDFPNIPFPARHGVDSLRRLQLGLEIESKLFWQNGARLYGLRPDAPP